ncbi:MAG: hypothetical protein WA093_02825 [Minisyncoccales bacterium]
MPLFKFLSIKKCAVYLSLAGLALGILVFGIVLADSGPVLKNVNPQGTVTSSSVKITLDTEDLARCRYSTSDGGYDSMGNNLDTPDGLYHSASLGTLNAGPYTYYVRCKDFEGNANGSSAVVKFTVGSISCVGENCPTITPGGTAPVLSGLLPSGTTYNSYVTLSVKTNEAANCRYSWYDKAFDEMTLVFSTSDQKYHTATASLSNYGYYTYNVRCRNTAGNVNQVAGKISFRYANKNPVVSAPVVVAPKDTAAPEISNLMPAGDVNAASTTISCVTDEAATCKYDISDTGYDSMANTMDGAGSKNHSKIVALDAAGRYTYYIRCNDKSGNKSNSSSQIGFNYVAPVKEGPVISNLQPTGAIYQSNVALIVTTDKAADCRYSDSDADFETMHDSFSTNDGSLHQATVNLDDYGAYAYYVRCRDTQGNADDRSEVINFEYKNPNPDEIDGENLGETNIQPEPPAEVTCAETKNGGKDGVCDTTVDCICDLDCPASGDDADPDCANVAPAPASNGWIAIILIGLALLVIIVIIIVIIKRRGNGEEDVELP